MLKISTDTCVHFLCFALPKECVSDCCLTPRPIFQLNHGENQFHFDEMMVMSSLY